MNLIRTLDAFHYIWLHNPQLRGMFVWFNWTVSISLSDFGQCSAHSHARKMPHQLAVIKLSQWTPGLSSRVHWLVWCC
jgi:hypothetical protein